MCHVTVRPGPVRTRVFHPRARRHVELPVFFVIRDIRAAKSEFLVHCGILILDAPIGACKRADQINVVLGQ
jgi:hypothetical protein